MDQPQQELQPHLPTAPGGQIPLDSACYIELPIIESLCHQAIQEPVAILNIRAPKQMGKSYLMSRIPW